MNDDIKAGDTVRYGKYEYKVAVIGYFVHGEMIGIYDEPPSLHIDWLNPESVELVKEKSYE